MNWEDLADAVISMGAPLLGGLLGGPAGAAAGQMVAGVFQADPKHPDGVLNAIQSDPEALAKLRQFELEHKVRLEELQLKAAQLALQDLASARERELAIVKATGRRDPFQPWLAAITFAAFFGVVLATVLMMAFGAQHALANMQNSPILMMLIGAQISGFTQVLSYYFGSSKGSADKTAMLGAKG